ncbi:hypothetical protein SARC_14277 [Sphaeroforma arctica JP610]|uniref:Uncharacterized protein n=1 Tax=Sphaeroforma arctica JP610 TaxID=667725 RepID=A0A0L0F8X3_9EUKA|nr:hypothetical protein SARC_14277 [Sphaeroforma arctica JP610]KNC73165.1 hypothetical protein SARC_14277 [Sphaeroforma arctica JP610]|eukprot:XP_014147067.1 hypothetical protein SARC_14277 [Sphaeroforma arctica JP610]
MDTAADCVGTAEILKKRRPHLNLCPDLANSVLKNARENMQEAKKWLIGVDSIFKHFNGSSFMMTRLKQETAKINNGRSLDLTAGVITGPPH